MALRDTLEAAWYGDGRAPWWTWPLMALYSVVIHVRRALYHLGWLSRVELDVPVVVATMHVAWGSGFLRGVGRKVGRSVREEPRQGHAAVLYPDPATPSPDARPAPGEGRHHRLPAED